MFTAQMARNHQNHMLDERIKLAVEGSEKGGAYLRISSEDWFFNCIQSELEQRGFKNVSVPDMVMGGDVYFEW